MAYNLPLQISIQAPTSSNISAIKKQIESGLSGINIKGFDAKNFAKANSQIDLVTKNLEKGEDAAKSFFDRVEGKARSFAAYTVASTAILKLTGAVSAATREAIKYETELLKISQVTGDSVKSTREYGKTLAAISKQYNVNISKVAQLTRTLTQTGLSFREAAKGAEVLAKTSLLATFDSLTSTTEGLIAVMQTFNLTVSAGADVLEKINAVSKSFAVEASDIVEAIRRTGGAFSTAGGQIEDLIALFTAVRSTSRESAETIATGFRTIFGRLQRPKTIEYFKELGIQLETAEGQFVGPLQAIKNISEGLEELGIRAGSVRFAEIVEQIGGIRQISRVVPLLEQFRKTQAALDIQNEAGVQSAEDLAKAQQGLGFQLGQLKQEFTDLIQTVVNSDSFKFLADIFINSAKAVIRLVASLKPLLPILATVAAFKIGRGLSKLLSGGVNLKGMKGAAGFASGGIVPGSGNSDTVPAMLTPGEFVIRKSAVQAFGASNLASINKYKKGGKASYKPKDTGDPLLRYERFGMIGSEELPKEQVSYSEINNLGLEPAVAGGLKGAMYEKYMQQRYGIDKPDGSGSFPDVNASKAAQLIKDAGLGAKVGNKLLDGAELKYRLTEDTVKRYREGLRGQKSAKNIPMIYAEGQKFAKGGTVGTDTVPALLTPGEFVVNKKSAQSFGYGNLKKINRYAAGGMVQRFKDGGGVSAISGEGVDFIDFGDLQASAELLGESMRETAKATKDNAKVTDETAKKTKMSFVELLVGIQSVASGLKVFAGLDLNQEALTSGQVMAGQFNLISDGLKNINKEGLQKFNRTLFDAGKNAQSFGSKLAAKGGITGLAGKAAGGVGGGISKIAVQFAKFGPKIISGAMMLAKAFNIASWVSLIGGFADALFSVDYKKLKDQAIDRGDVEAAGANAAAQYNQEFYRGIPLIGGFLAALQPLMPAFMTQLDATGKLAVATAELEATMVGFDKKMKKANTELDLASQRGNAQEIQAALAKQQDVLKDLGKRADRQSTKVQEVQSQRAARSATYSLGGMSSIGAGTASLVSWFKGEHDMIMKGLEQQREAYAKLSEETVQRINKVSSMMTASGLKIIEAGGSIEDAFNHMNTMFGADNVKEMFGDVTPTAEGLEEAYQNLKQAGDGYNDTLNKLKDDLGGAEEDLAAAWPNWLGGSKKQKEEALEQIKVQVQQAEGTIAENEARKKAIVAMATQYNQQIALNKERAIEAAAIAKQIEMSRKLTAVFDKFSRITGNIADAEDEAERMRGDRRQLGRQGALDISGITNAGVSSGTLRMSGNQVLRDENAFNEMLGAVQRMERAQGEEGVFSSFLERSRSDMAQIQRLDEILSPEAVTELRTKGIEEAGGSIRSESGEINEELATTAGDSIRKQLIEKLNLGDQPISEELNAALLEYGKLVASGVSGVEATQQIKEKLGEEAAKFLDNFQGLYDEVIEKEQKLRAYQVELADRRLEEEKRAYELVIKTYDAEREYFQKRFDLANDVEDFLNPVTDRGPDRSRQLGLRASERRDVQMQELQRNRAQAGIGNIDQARAGFGADLGGLDVEAENAAGELEKLAQRGDLLAKTISDEIDIEREHMESLKEMAAAEQAYQQELNDAKGALTRSIVFGTEEQRADTFNTLNAAALAASQGSLAGIPEDMRAGIESTLEQFANVVIPGLGLTGRQAQERIATNELMQMGFDPATAAQRAKEMVQEKVPIDKKMADQIQNQKEVLEKLYADQAAHDQAMRDLEAKQNEVFKVSNDLFAETVKTFEESVNVLKQELGLINGNAGAGQGRVAGAAGGGAGAAGGGDGAVGGAGGGGAGAAGGAGGGGAGAAGGRMQEPRPVPTYGLSEEQQELARKKDELRREREELIAKKEAGTLTADEEQRLYDNTFATARTNTALTDSGASSTDVRLYQQAYNQSLERQKQQQAQAAQQQAQAAQQQAQANAPPTTSSAYTRGSSGPDLWQDPSGFDPFADTGAASPPSTLGKVFGGIASMIGSSLSNLQNPPGGRNPMGGQSGNQQPQSQSGPISIDMQGQQDITVRLPDVQALANGVITSMVYNAISETFNQIADTARNANPQNFEDLINSIEEGATSATTVNFGSNGS